MWKWWLIAFVFLSNFQVLKADCKSEKSKFDALVAMKKASFPVSQTENGWMSPGKLAQSWFSSEVHPVVLYDLNDLRYLPHSLPETEVVLVSDRFELSEKQVAQIRAVADLNSIGIHLFWYSEDFPPALARQLISGGLLVSSADFDYDPSCS